MKIDRATPIGLGVWKDPQSFVLIEHVRDEAWLYIRCLEPDGLDSPYVGCLHFEGVWHLSSSRFKKLRAYPEVQETDLISYYLVVENSSLVQLLQERRTAANPDWQIYDHRIYQHWIVESHDFYTDIVASRVSFSRGKGGDARRCFELWDKV